MQTTFTVFTDKVTRLLQSMVYLAMRCSCPGGATVGEIAGLLVGYVPDETGRYHEGLVERVLRQLQNDGKVTRVGAQWYPVLEG